MYVLKTGAAKFYIAEEEVGTASQGASLGHTALLYTSPQAGTVIVIKETSFFQVDQIIFCKMLKVRTERLDNEKQELLKTLEIFKDV